ncbi:ABC transporter substrate binding protein [Desulfitobacterium hafniense DP7]|uniref:ABC transporter substrate binding protein n=1 Tax=Desulfitobacterium hafniense DP7 TaxID=537010 RepID=G9XI71_DESHA|nr:ABC transporter substrate-binding protein [Desulfitobacterium hafniense]EHL08554.1 ABC transporter substrate binding protein [Desulfitobacterium hafniense DP7]
MKKTLAKILTLMLLLAAAGCSAETTPKNSDSANAIQVGLVQLADNGAFTDMREGFIDKLRELGYTEEQLVIDYKNANGDTATLNSIFQTMVDAQKDLIVTIGTPATQAIVNMDSGIPVFFISVSNPVGAKVITDMSTPDKHATGTSNAIPVSEMFKLSDQLTPNRQTYGLIYNTGEVNAVTTIEQAKNYLDSVGLNYKEAIVTSSSEVQQAAESLVGSVDAFFIPNDSMVQSAMPQVAEIAKQAKLPVYGSSAVMVQSGAFATVSIDDITIGGITAEMAVKFLKGTPIEQIPAITVSDFTTVINQSTADAIGVTIPQDILSHAAIIE